MFTRQYKNKHKWCAFIDIDEFIIRNTMMFIIQMRGIFLKV